MGDFVVSENDYFEVRLLDGRRVSVDIAGSTSIFTDIHTFKFDFSWCQPDVEWQNSLRRILLDLLSTHSVVYANRCAYYAARFARDLRIQTKGVNSALLLKDLADWPKNYGVESWAFMQAVLGRWVRSKLPGLDPDIADFLQSPEKWEEKSGGCYFALVANNPRRGALTEQELKNIQDAVNGAYEKGVISLNDWALVWFLIGTGVRPVQIARMTIADVISTVGPEGKEITLCIPLAKGENAVSKIRWKRKAPTVLAEVMMRYLESHPSASLPDATLFSDQSIAIYSRIKLVFDRIETYSSRLDGPIPIFPYRFRYTLGTRALALGASDHEVARLLTHRTTHCVQYYRASMPQLQAPIKDAIGQEMSFMAQAFQGRLIDNLDQATRKGEASALIRDFANLLGQSIGACGTRAECYQDAPRACVTCRKFEPFRDAPWEDILKVMIKDMETETEDRIKLITQEQIEAVRGIMANARQSAEAA